MDTHLRKLRYFMVLAEELHFTRAASRLFIAQQSLSRQIRDLEAEVGATLLYRTKRTVHLTPAGEAFRAKVEESLRALDMGVDEARMHASGAQGVLNVGFGMGAALELTPYILDEYSKQHPRVDIELREFPLLDQTAGLADGWADVAIVRPPLAADGIRWQTLFVEPRVLTVSASHELAKLDAVSVADILDVPLTIGRSADEEYRRFWSLDDLRPQTPESPVVKRTTSNTEEIELVAAGLACTINPAAIMRYIPHPGVRYIPINDVPGSVVAVAWRQDQCSPLATAFNRVAQRVRRREVDVVTSIEDPFATRTFENN